MFCRMSVSIFQYIDFTYIHTEMHVIIILNMLNNLHIVKVTSTINLYGFFLNYNRVEVITIALYPNVYHLSGESRGPPLF